jgi:hypothetical protein
LNTALAFLRGGLALLLAMPSLLLATEARVPAD